VVGDIGADQRRVVLAAGVERTLAIAHAAFGLLGFGVSQQDQAHGIDFSAPGV